jgi:hypothetical protein
MQLNLFPEEEKVLKPQALKGELVACKTCGDKYPHTSEYFHIRNRITTLKYGGREYLFYRCKKCVVKTVALVKRLKVTYKDLKTENCDCCSKKTDRLCLDHCHKTLKFRGWVCNECNTGLGLLGDNKEGLNVALKYLESCNDKA